MDNHVWEPMLCQNLRDNQKRVSFPCFVQPKLDGIRCLLTPKGFYTRNGKKIAGVPKLEAAVKASGLINWRLDGELYCPGKGFNQLSSVIRRTSNIREDESIAWHVFDINIPEPFSVRKTVLEAVYATVSLVGGVASEITDRVKLVETILVQNKWEMSDYLQKCLKDGYEGIIVRSRFGHYAEGKRSYDCMKFKPIIDEECTVIGFEAGKEDHRLQNSLGALVCVNERGEECKVGTGFSDRERKEIWKHQDKYLGRVLTVKVQARKDAGNALFRAFVGWREDK